jgi:hypothetical protein
MQNKTFVYIIEVTGNLFIWLSELKLVSYIEVRHLRCVEQLPVLEY